MMDVAAPDDDEEEEEEGGADEYEVEKILEKREIGGLLEYKVKWRGWDAEEDMTWEPADNLGGSEDLIKMMIMRALPSRAARAWAAPSGRPRCARWR